MSQQYLIAQTHGVYIGRLVEDGVVVPITGLTTNEIIFTFPDGTTEIKTASLTTDGSDGKTQVTLSPSDLLATRTGQWRATLHIVLSGNTIRSLPTLFEVKGTEDGV